MPKTEAPQSLVLNQTIDEDRQLSSDDKERLERNIKRAPDGVTSFLTEAFERDGQSLGPLIVDQTFYPESVGSFRQDEITYDRFYPVVGLLMKWVYARRTYEEPIDNDIDSEIKVFKDYADEKGFNFIAVIDDMLDREDVVRAVKVKATYKRATQNLGNVHGDNVT